MNIWLLQHNYMIRNQLHQYAGSWRRHSQRPWRRWCACAAEEIGRFVARSALCNGGSAVIWWACDRLRRSLCEILGVTNCTIILKWGKLFCSRYNVCVPRNLIVLTKLSKKESLKLISIVTSNCGCFARQFNVVCWF